MHPTKSRPSARARGPLARLNRLMKVADFGVAKLRRLAVVVPAAARRVEAVTKGRRASVVEKRRPVADADERRHLQEVPDVGRADVDALVVRMLVARVAGDAAHGCRFEQVFPMRGFR